MLASSETTQVDSGCNSRVVRTGWWLLNDPCKADSWSGGVQMENGATSTAFIPAPCLALRHLAILSEKTVGKAAGKQP